MSIGFSGVAVHALRDHWTRRHGLSAHIVRQPNGANAMTSENLKKLQQARAATLDQWQDALDYEAALLQALTAALDNYVETTSPTSDLAEIFAGAWRDQLEGSRLYAIELQDVNSLAEVKKGLQDENLLLVRLIEQLDARDQTGDPIGPDIIDSWRADFEREIDVNDETLDQIRSMERDGV